MSKHLSWKSHKGHWEMLKEFYALNKYLITEQLKDTLLDAIECMEYIIIEKGENYETVESELIKMKNTYYNDFKIKTEIGTIILRNDWSNRVKTACKINHLKEKDICYVHYNCTANETIIQYRKEVK